MLPSRLAFAKLGFRTGERQERGDHGQRSGLRDSFAAAKGVHQGRRAPVLGPGLPRSRHQRDQRRARPVRSGDLPQETLLAIIDHHIDFVFDHTASIVTWRTDFRNLPEADSHRLRYLQRLYTAEWVRTVSKLRPELSENEVRARCDAAIALLQSPTEFHSVLPREKLAPILSRMAADALLCSDVSTKTAKAG
jgi:hypothetical protein